MLFRSGVATVVSYPFYLKNHINDDITVNISSTKGMGATLLGGLGVNQINKNASMLLLSMNSSRPGKSTDILNNLVAQYNKDAIDDKNVVIESSSIFLQKRLDIIKDELNDIDDKIEGYKKTTQTVNPSSESMAYVQKVTAVEEKMSDLDIQLSLINLLSDFLKKDSNKNELLPYNIGLDNAGLNSQIQSYNDNLIRLNRMMAASSERNPVVADLTISMEAARSSIEKTVEDMKQSLDIRYKELHTIARRTSGRLEASSTNEKTLQSIMRDQKTKSELYMYLLNKIEDNAILKSTTEPNARVIDRAYGSDIPVSPKKQIILLTFLAIGFVIPAVYFVLKDMFYTKVRGRSDVERAVQVPILGEIPSKSKAEEDKAIVVTPGSTSAVSESFRILRTNLGFFMSDKDKKVIAITSSVTGEGKTYVSMNLAMTLALTGKKVCIVDLDLRRSSLSTGLNVSRKKGVSAYLSGTVNDIKEMIQPSRLYETLEVISSGVVPPNPAELLMNERFDRMIGYLKDNYDYVILDNPPAHVVADTKISNRAADVTCFVVRSGVLDRRELESIQTLYKEQTLNNMCIVITDVDYEKLYYSIGYKGYGKRYGYGRYDSKSTKYGQTYLEQ